MKLLNVEKTMLKNDGFDEAFNIIEGIVNKCNKLN